MNLANLLVLLLSAQRRVRAHGLHLRARVFLDLAMLLHCLLRNSGNLPAGLLPPTPAIAGVV
jgi:hypothetical protein